MAYKKTTELIEAGNLDTIFISGDERAFGVYKAIKERNLRIPEDIAVLSIDNIKYSNYITPPLTTISQEIDIFSKEVIDMLVEIIKSENNRVQSKMIEPKMIIRKST